MAVSSPASTTVSGEGLGCSSILNQPQLSGGAGKGATSLKHGTARSLPKDGVRWAIGMRST